MLRMSLILLFIASFSQSVNAADRAQLISTYRMVMTETPKNLVDHLNSDDIETAKREIQLLYFTWEALSPKSDMRDEELAKETCADGYQWVCRNILVSSTEAIKGLYFGNPSEEKMKVLAKQVLDNSFLE